MNLDPILYSTVYITTGKYCCNSFHLSGHTLRFHPAEKTAQWLSFWEQKWRDGESTHLLPLWPELNSRTRSHMWVEFVVGPRPCSERFPPDGSSVFPSSQKPTFLNSEVHFDLESVPN